MPSLQRGETLVDRAGLAVSLDPAVEDPLLLGHPPDPGSGESAEITGGAQQGIRVERPRRRGDVFEPQRGAPVCLDFVNIVEPDVVVLGGGVTRSGAQLLDPVRRIVADGAMEPAARAVRVELAALGDAVCVVGAGVLALDAG
jgi:glucokinase